MLGTYSVIDIHVPRLFSTVLLIKMSMVKGTMFPYIGPISFVTIRRLVLIELLSVSHHLCSIGLVRQEREFFSEKDGLPRRPFPNGWKGECGLYAVGFTKRGILGASMDAMRIAQDIEQRWKTEAKQLMAFHRSSGQK